MDPKVDLIPAYEIVKEELPTISSMNTVQPACPGITSRNQEILLKMKGKQH